MSLAFLPTNNFAEQKGLCKPREGVLLLVVFVLAIASWHDENIAARPKPTQKASGKRDRHRLEYFCLQRRFAWSQAYIVVPLFPVERGNPLRKHAFTTSINSLHELFRQAEDGLSAARPGAHSPSHSLHAFPNDPPSCLSHETLGENRASMWYAYREKRWKHHLGDGVCGGVCMIRPHGGAMIASCDTGILIPW